jgi:hypothetical protein
MFKKYTGKSPREYAELNTRENQGGEPSSKIDFTIYKSKLLL